MRNLKKAHAEYEDKKSQELEFLTKEAEAIRIRDRENQNKLIFLERDFDVVNDENRRLKKDLETTKNDSDQMMKMLENFE